MTYSRSTPFFSSPWWMTGVYTADDLQAEVLGEVEGPDGGGRVGTGIHPDFSGALRARRRQEVSFVDTHRIISWTSQDFLFPMMVNSPCSFLLVTLEFESFLAAQLCWWRRGCQT